MCGSKPCWKVLGIKGFLYKDALRTPEGADKVSLKAGLDGKAKTQFKGKGPDLQPFALPFTLPVTAQLRSENGECWAASFSPGAGVRNDSTPSRRPSRQPWSRVVASSMPGGSGAVTCASVPLGTSSSKRASASAAWSGGKYSSRATRPSGSNASSMR